MKSAFLASMSHEFRTPLNSIIGFTSLLANGAVGPLNDEQKNQLGLVRKSGYHLLSLVNDVLDISRIEAGKIELFLEPFDLRAVLDGVIDRVRPLANEKGLEITCEVSRSVGQVTNDKRRVEQIVTNLVSNAIKFTAKGSIQVSCGKADGGFSVAVKDTGIGIDKALHAAVFSAFTQVDSGLDRRHEGTGLGLSICEKLATQLGGTVSLESELGQGSTFTVTLPDG